MIDPETIVFFRPMISANLPPTRIKIEVMRVSDENTYPSCNSDNPRSFKKREKNMIQIAFADTKIV